MDTQFPITIYKNKKKLKQMLLLYIGLLLMCIITFWFASGKLFTEDYYYPKATLFMAAGIPIFIFAVFFHIKELSNNEAIMTLDDKGIKYNKGIYKQISDIAWSDLYNISEAMIGNSKFIRILIEKPDKYISQLSKAKDQEKLHKQVLKSDGFLPLMIAEEHIGYDLIEFETIIKKKIVAEKQ